MSLNCLLHSYCLIMGHIYEGYQDKGKLNMILPLFYFRRRREGRQTVQFTSASPVYFKDYHDL